MYPTNLCIMNYNVFDDNFLNHIKLLTHISFLNGTFFFTSATILTIILTIMNSSFIIASIPLKRD